MLPRWRAGTLLALTFLAGGCLKPAEPPADTVRQIPQVALPEPAAAWDCARPAHRRPGDRILHDVEEFRGHGSDPALCRLHFLPSTIRPEFVAATQVTWLIGPRGDSALSLGSFGRGAECSAVLQGGDAAATTPTHWPQATLFLRFRLNGPMAYGGGAPGWELDGQLLNLGPGLALKLAGRGPNGRNRHLPVLTVSSADGAQRRTAEFSADLADELQPGRWYALAVPWDGSRPEQPVTFRLDGRPCNVRSANSAAPVPTAAEITGPLRLGGDRSWGNVPLDLAGFAVYPTILTPEQTATLFAYGVGASPAAATEPARPEYERLTAANRPEGWQTPASGTTLSAAANDTLELSFAALKTGDASILLLSTPVEIDAGVETLDFWACSPSAPLEYGFAFVPLFADAKGGEIEGDGASFLASHIGAPNSRRGGLWWFIQAEIPRKKSASRFLGFRLRGEYTGSKLPTEPRRVYFADLGLDRLDYRRTALYYVVGNYRDNFLCTAFNSAGARAVTGAATAADEPFVLIDNLVDQAKQGRPARLDLELSVFDTQDRLVYQARRADLPAATAADARVRLPIPITAPGTYRIRGRSYHAETKAWFTTDWTKLIIIRGAGMPDALPPVRDTGLLVVNPQQPYGVFAPGAKPEIDFQIGHHPDLGTAPCELRWTVIPYDQWLPGWQAARKVTFDQSRAVTPGERLRIPHPGKRTAELVIAELWQNGRCREREERPLAVRNGLSKAPPFTARNRIPSLADLAGPGKNWMNVQFHSNPGQDLYAAVARDIGEAKKLTPNLGIGVELSRLNPLPGVYNWDALTPSLDLAEREQCRLVLYENLKWPVDWAPIEFQVDSRGRVHRGGVMWGYMVGKYLYPSGEVAPGIIEDFNRQLARRYLNHPGLGAYYFENEHIHSFGGPLDSYHEAYRRRFATFLEKRYRKIQELNRRAATAYARFADVPLPAMDEMGNPPAALLQADFHLFQMAAGEEFLRKREFAAVRQEDPQRPIIVYNLGDESAEFLRYVAANGGMMANGGVHSNVNTDFEYERFNAIPGLLYRMEPHDMWNYDPIPQGFDEMIFGMLGMGGRGLGFHIFLQGAWGHNSEFKYDAALKPGQKTGFDKLVGKAPMLRELRDTEKLHDPVGILGLHGLPELGGPFEWGAWNPHLALYVYNHYSPKFVPAEGDPAYLDGSQAIFIGGSGIDRRQSAYLLAFLQRGGRIVMEATAGQYDLEDPNADRPHAFLHAAGVDFFQAGETIPGIPWPHDRYRLAGGGEILVLRRPLWNDKWDTIIPPIMTWAGVNTRLANSGDRFMQIHVLQHDTTFYLATTHRSQQQSGYSGTSEWEGQVAFGRALPPGRYRVTELMGDREVGVFTPEQLAAGFPAGHYADLQLKIFRIAPCSARE